MSHTELANAILPDVEDAVEHLPLRKGRGEVDWTFWRQTDTYLTLYADCALLKSAIGDHRILELREKILAKWPITKQQIDEAVASAVGHGEDSGECN